MKHKRARRRARAAAQPDLAPNEAQALTRFVAWQRARGQITEEQAEDHVADIEVRAGHIPMRLLFEAELQRLGGPRRPQPIPMRLVCPGILPDGITPCATLHLDEGEFATKPHHTHSCQRCGMTWRPAVPDTVGVQFLPGFRSADREREP